MNSIVFYEPIMKQTGEITFYDGDIYFSSEENRKIAKEIIKGKGFEVEERNKLLSPTVQWGIHIKNGENIK